MVYAVMGFLGFVAMLYFGYGVLAAIGVAIFFIFLPFWAALFWALVLATAGVLLIMVAGIAVWIMDMFGH